MAAREQGSGPQLGLRVEVCPDYGALSREAAEVVVQALRATPNMLLCAATGASPEGLYAELVARCRQHPEVFDALRVVKLDEWGGLPMNDPATCESYLQQHLLQPLGIPPGRYFGFDSSANDPTAECRRVQQVLDAQGLIDLCVLGIGLNGHIALNEPADELTPYAHVSELAPESRQHTMLRQAGGDVTHGLTLGMADILHARKILLLVSGAGKREVLSRLLRSPLTTRFPASLLRLHPDVTILCDRQSAGAGAE